MRQKNGVEKKMKQKRLRIDNERDLHSDAISPGTDFAWTNVNLWHSPSCAGAKRQKRQTGHMRVCATAGHSWQTA